MTTSSDNPEALTVQAGKVARDEVRDRSPNAKRRFKSPELLMADSSLSDTEKLALLQDWDLELSNRLKAEEEGMSASDPIGEQQEARLADEAARVKTLLTDLAGRTGESG